MYNRLWVKFRFCGCKIQDRIPVSFPVTIAQIILYIAVADKLKSAKIGLNY